MPLDKNQELHGMIKNGLNDMVVHNGDVYVAGYGSILRVTNNGKTETLENIGGENFTHICVGGDYLFACSYSGNIYCSEIGSNSWKKISTLGKKLLFIVYISTNGMFCCQSKRRYN